MDTKLQETERFGEESSGKKKSKFKSIKKFFGKRKKKETLSSSGSGSLKTSQSTSDVTDSQPVHVDYDSEDELEIHRSVMGSRALSHDSIFIPEAAQEPARPGRVFSQENVSDRIKALQLKLQQNWKSDLPYTFETPSSKRMDDAGINSEDDGLPRSPPETSLLQEILSSNITKFSDSHKHLSSLSLGGTGSEEEEQVTSSPFRTCFTESQPLPGQSSAKIITLRTSDCSLSPPADFDAPPEFSSCLDNTAAKHKLLVKPRNQRSSKKRRSPLTNLSESQNDLSSTLEEDENDKKGMPAEETDEVTSSHQELRDEAASLDATSAQQPEMLKILQQPALSHQGKEAYNLHSTSELDSLLYGNSQEGYKIRQGLPQTASLSSSSNPKKDTPTPYLDQEKRHQEILKMPPRNLSGISLSTVNEEKNISDISLKNHTISNKNALVQKDMISTSDGTEKDMLKDIKALPEVNCNKSTVKGSPSVFNPTSLSPNNILPSTDLASNENSSIAHTVCTAPSSQADVSFLTLDKVKPDQEKPKSDKDTYHPALPGVLILAGKTEKEASDLSALRKFSVSAACGRPRASSLNIKDTLKETSEFENLVATQVWQAKTKNSSKTTKVETVTSSFQEKKSHTKKEPFLPESELESPSRVLDKEMVLPQTLMVGSKPVLNSTPGGLPQQSSAGRFNCEDKSPFHIKLRSTSLSLRNKESSSEELKETKRHSAEFHLEKGGAPVSSSPQGEKSEIRKTPDVNINSFLNGSLKVKSKPSEQSSTKPPLPRKPLVQHLIISGNNARTEKQENITRYSELKSEDKDSGKKPGPPEVAEKNVPSLGIAVDTARTSESSGMPAWITIAKQKQRLMEQDLSKEEKPGTQVKTDSEKQTTEKLNIEEAVKQQADFTWSTISPSPPVVSFEEQKKETKLDMQESFPGASLLSHHHPVQSPVSIEKEDAKSIKKASHLSPDQPSWMELAKKKSQAWSDMPQRIK